MCRTDYQTEFYVLMDRRCQEIVDSLYKIIGELNHYEQKCNFALPHHFQKLREHIREMLQSYSSPEEK
jgi:hypothetical protein